MSAGLQPAARIHRQIAGKRAAPLADEVHALAFAAESQVFVVGDLGPGEAVVHLRQVDFRHRILNARHAVSLFGSRARRREPDIFIRGIVPRPPAGTNPTYSFAESYHGRPLVTASPRPFT